jgi:hypothetical protein
MKNHKPSLAFVRPLNCEPVGFPRAIARREARESTRKSFSFSLSLSLSLSLSRTLSERKCLALEKKGTRKELLRHDALDSTVLSSEHTVAILCI